MSSHFVITYLNHTVNPFKMQIIQSLQNRIYEIRGERGMLDRDLATPL